jgi:hypothetical protein
MRRCAAFALLAIATCMIFAVSSVPAFAGWPGEPVFEKYDASGARLWARPRPFDEGAGPFAIDRAGRIYMITAKGYEVRTPDYVLIRKVDIKGTYGGDDVAIGSKGYVYVADRDAHRVQVFTSTGKFVRTFGHKGTTKGHFKWPILVECDRAGNVFVVDDTGRIQKFSSTGKHKRTFGGHGTGNGKFPLQATDIDVDAAGNVYTSEAAFEESDPSPNRVQKFSNSGTFVRSWPVGGASIVCDPVSGFWTSNWDAVRRYSATGVLEQTFTGAAGTEYPSGGGSPWFLDVDSLGNFYVMSFAAG